MTECKVTKCIIPVIAVFLTIFGFEWLFHGMYMMPQYEATASQWRPMDQMQQFWWVCLSTKLVMAAVITCLYGWMAKGCAMQGKCTGKGVKFGLKIGVLLGAQQFASYVWLPIPMEMAVSWLVGNIIMGILIGIVLSIVFRMCNKGECSTQ